MKVVFRLLLAIGLPLFSDAPPPQNHFRLIRQARLQWPSSVALDFNWLNQPSAAMNTIYIQVRFSNEGSVIGAKSQTPLSQLPLSSPWERAIEHAVRSSQFQAIRPCTEVDHPTECTDNFVFEIGALTPPTLESADLNPFPSMVASCDELWEDGIWTAYIPMVVGEDGLIDPKEINVLLIQVSTGLIQNQNLIRALFEKYFKAAAKKWQFKPALGPDQQPISAKVFGWYGIEIKNHLIKTIQAGASVTNRVQLPEKFTPPNDF